MNDISLCMEPHIRIEVDRGVAIDVNILRELPVTRKSNGDLWIVSSGENFAIKCIQCSYSAFTIDIFCQLTCPSNARPGTIFFQGENAR